MPLASSERSRQHHLDENRRGRLADVTASPQRSETIRAGPDGLRPLGRGGDIGEPAASVLIEMMLPTTLRRCQRHKAFNLPLGRVLSYTGWRFFGADGFTIHGDAFPLFARRRSAV